MQAASAAQKSQRAQTVLAGSIPVPSRCSVGGTSPQALACDAPEAAGLPKGPDGNHGDNLKSSTGVAIAKRFFVEVSGGCCFWFANREQAEVDARRMVAMGFDCVVCEKAA